jgi:hypothetical protein
MESTSKISDICYEQIKGDYWYASYLGTKVVMMKSSGYINITKLCTDGGKRFKHWLENKHSKEMLEFYQNIINQSSSSDGIPSDENQAIPSNVRIKIVGGKSNEDVSIRGTYLHPKLMPHVASWVNLQFGYRVSCIVEDYVIAEIARELATAKQELERQQEQTLLAQQQAQQLEQVVGEKDLVIDIKQAALEMVQQQAQQFEAIAVRQDGLIQAATTEIKQAQQQAQQLVQTIQLKEKCHRIWSSTHAFTLLRTNNPESKRPYYAIRRARRSMSGAIKKFQTKYPTAAIVFKRAYVPNPINLYTRLKASDILCFSRNFCSSLFGEVELIKKLTELADIV